MKIRLTSLLGCFLVASTLLLACKPTQERSSDTPMENPATTDRIEYRFRDSSVPPFYHRSYTITAGSDSARIVVDVYGKEIFDSSYQISGQDWEKLLGMAAELQKPSSYTSDMSGTKSYRVRLFEGDDETYQLYWDSGNDKRIQPETIALGRQMEALIPDFPDCLQRGKEIER